MERRDWGFNLTITSLEQFAIFVALVRGDSLDDDKIQALIQRLNRQTTQLDESVKHNA